MQQQQQQQMEQQVSSQQAPTGADGKQTPERHAKENPAAVRAVLLNPVRVWLSDTTAHGLGRLVGQRPVYVKLVWLIGFSLCLTAFVTQVQTFIETYIQQPETTTLKQNSVEFDFPDVIICNKAVMSGSYPYIMDAGNVSVINGYLTQLLTLLGAPTSQIMAPYFVKALLASIPYRLLSDHMGHHTAQFLFTTSVNGLMMNQVPFNTFHSPSELNCIRMQLTDVQKSVLKAEGNYLEIGLFLDASFFTFPRNSSLLPMPIANQTNALDFLAWDLASGISVDSSNGVNMYFARPGHYPDTESMIQLSAGKDYLINLEIARLILSKGMSCLTSPEPRSLLSPYDGAAVSYPYSEFLCRAERSNDLLLQQKGCVSHLLPRDKKFGNATRCLNTARVLSGQVSLTDYTAAMLTDAYSSLSLDQRAVQQYCSSRRPCKTDSYIYTYSFGTWPRIFSSYQREILSQFQAMVLLKMIQFPGYPFPGYADVLSVANSLINNLTTHNIVIGTGYFQDQAMRIRIYTGKTLGSSVQIEKSYDLVNLVADTGGLLGLYLGCSLLTVLEVLELLHDCLIGCFSTGASLRSRRRLAAGLTTGGDRRASAVSRASISSSVCDDLAGDDPDSRQRRQKATAIKVTNLDA